MRVYIIAELRKRWSPREIVKRMKMEYPHNEDMRISHEAIYQYIYVMPRGSLKRTIIHALRQERKHRRKQFKQMLSTQLLPQLPAGTHLVVDMRDSTTDTNVQIADWITGALAKYLNDKPLGKECFDMLRPSIIGEGKEMFKDHWEKKYDNQKIPN